MRLRFLLAATALPALLTAPSHADTRQEAVATYSRIAYATYSDALAQAESLQKAVNALLAKPDAKTLAAAKAAWLAARTPYSQTEVFRFYEGPIDFEDHAAGKSGPEALLNSWPLNEAYIDYVKGNPKAGIINAGEPDITAETLAKKNQSDDEADVTTGYHAIEFLLWGQDVSASGPGARPFTDYLQGKPANDRRRDYLSAATALLVQNLRELAQAWAPGQENYARQFTADSNAALAKILTGMASLSGFEMASERMGTALDSGDQEDEQSCFSDNTHNDFIDNARGIKNVYTGQYSGVSGPGIYDALKEKDAALADALLSRINRTESLMAAIPHPLDREVLASPKGSKARAAMEAAVASLQEEAKLIRKAGEALGVEVNIVTK